MIMSRVAATIIGAFVWCQTASGQQAAPPVDVSPATVVNVPSSALGGERQATVLVPAGYATSQSRYPVLYLLHGGGQDHTAFAARAWFRDQLKHNLIIVTPNAGDSWYVNSAVDSQARFEDFIIQDLVPFIDGRYRTRAGRDTRAIAGVSMGAWGAMLLGLKHHHLFGAVGSLSAPFGISRQDPDMDMKSRTQQRFGAPGTAERRSRDPGALAAEIPESSLPRLFLACGSQDLFVRDNRAFTQRLSDRKLPYEYREISPLGHSWDVWDPQLVNYITGLSQGWSK
jgi:enterochelin esterase-like enzyme